MKVAATRAVAIATAAVAIAATLAGCGLRDRGRDAPQEPSPSPTSVADSEAWRPAAEPCTTAGTHRNSCPVPGYDDRPFDVYVPASYSPDAAMPVVVFLHGGGGNSQQTQGTTCPGGDLTDPSCLHVVGEREGFITAYPNGTEGRLLPDVRTWNAGGGEPGAYACTSGYACENHVDDIAYLTAVLDELEREFHVDASRIYVTGVSNGAAMANRVGCEMSDRVAAIASVSGTNEYATLGPCDLARPMPVLHIHGTDDPCWTYVTSTQACLDQSPLPKLGVAESIAGWVERDACVDGPAMFDMPNRAADGKVSDVQVWSGCDGGAEVRLITVHGGEHAFPSGGLGVLGGVTGRSTFDFGSEVVWEFFARFSLP